MTHKLENSIRGVKARSERVATIQPSVTDNGKQYRFNLRQDLSESANLADQYPERTRTMTAQFRQWEETIFRN